MAHIDKIPDGLVVRLTPEEILPMYFDCKEGKDLRDAIAYATWKLLWIHARKFVTITTKVGGKPVETAKKFVYRDVQFVDGAFQVVFYDKPNPLPHTPPNP